MNCIRCNGQVIIPPFTHVLHHGIGGLCFRCHGTGQEPLTPREKRMKSEYKARALVQGYACFAKGLIVYMRTKSGAQYEYTDGFDTPKEANKAAWDLHFNDRALEATWSLCKEVCND